MSDIAGERIKYSIVIEVEEISQPPRLKIYKAKTKRIEINDS